MRMSDALQVNFALSNAGTGHTLQGLGFRVYGLRFNAHYKIVKIRTIDFHFHGPDVQTCPLQNCKKNGPLILIFTARMCKHAHYKIVKNGPLIFISMPSM
jgi:hypothetical protein